MSARLIQYRPASITLDVPASEVPDDTYTRGVNVQFRDGYATRSEGWSSIFPALPGSAEPWHLRNVTYQGVNYWIAVCKTGVYVTDTSIWYDITPAGWVNIGRPSDITSCLLNGIPCINTSAIAPFYWNLDTGTACLTLPDWPTNYLCQALASFKFHLFAMNITDDVGENFPGQLLWSDAAPPGQVPQSWTPAPNNDAGDNILAATRDPIYGAAQLRGQLIIYKSSSTFSCNYVAGTFVFAFRMLFSNSGALGPNCFVEIPSGRHAVLTDGDFVIHDGQNLESVIDRRVKRTIFNQIDPSKFVDSYVVNDKTHNEVLVCLPTLSSTYPDLALVWGYERNNLGFRDIGQSAHIAMGIVTEAGQDLTWDGAVGSWDEQSGAWNDSFFNPADDGAIMAQPDNAQLYYLDSATTQDGNDYESIVAREYLDMELPGMYKTVQRVWPRVEAPEGVEMRVRVGSSPTTDTPIEWSDYQAFNPGIQDKVDIFSTGRYLSFEFSTESGQQWTLNGFDVELVMRGAF